MSDPSNSPDPAAGWRDERRAERKARRDGMRSWFGGAPLGGLILLVLGAVLLAQNMGYSLPDRWWAAFLLIPAGGSLVQAIRLWRVDGRFTNRAMASLVGGAIFLVIAFWLYFGVGWGVFWPIILMLIGGAVMLRSFWSR